VGSIGGLELLVLIAIALVLFGAPVLTFLMGYALGKKQTGAADEAPPQSGPALPAEEQHPDE
jgi:hypothetical protein